MIQLSIVFPVFNEVKNLPHLINSINSASDHNFSTEFIFVDGGSSDGSRELLDNISKENLSIKLVCSNNSRGYGYDIIEGLNHASGDILAWTHADLQTDINDVFRAVSKLGSQTKTIVKGKRIRRNILDKLFSLLMEWYVFFKLGVKLDEINAQPKVFRRSFYHNLLKKNAPDDFSLDLYLLLVAKKRGYKIHDIPVSFHKRLFGIAKGGGSLKGKVPLIKRTISYINKTKV